MIISAEGARGEPAGDSYDALVVAPHPDDAETQMGGTLAKLSDRGQRILIVDLTAGEPTEFAHAGIRAEQAAAAAAILGVERLNLGLQDRLLADTAAVRLELVHLIRLHRPRWVDGIGDAYVHPDPASWQVLGQKNLYAIGDTADFPVKQAFLALGMAGVVAHNIAGQILGRAERATFDPTSMCIMEQFDTGLFAQVPLTLTEDPAHPVAVRPEGEDDYLVRDARLWQMGRLRTFHEGLLWSAMDLSVKGMEKVTA